MIFPLRIDDAIKRHAEVFRASASVEYERAAAPRKLSSFT
jgi:hypothetical protein